jgi:putative ATPase
MIPLAEKLRPQTLDSFVGQAHLVGENGFITRLIKTSQASFPSLIFWGPAGTGKTTLARIIAGQLKRTFYEFSSVTSSISDIKKVIPANSSAIQNSLLENTGNPLIFIDEIHRLNKAQQDAFLPHVEKGTITLIGATTENPSFEVVGPLLSRCRVVIFNQLEELDLKKIIEAAKSVLEVALAPDAEEFLIKSANGDARSILNVFQIAHQLASSSQISVEDVKLALQRDNVFFDKGGDEYYNTMSALHKSIRGSDPNASLYYLARMLEGGQDPLYIARRLVRAAAEDIGIADPQALVLAQNAFTACHQIGMPECAVVLAELTVYMAKAPKSNKVYLAYERALKDVRDHGNLPVPLHIRNAPTQLMKDLGFGSGYKYEHSRQGVKNTEIEFLPDKLKGSIYLK